MNNNFNNVVRSGVEDMIIAANSASVQRAEFGFVSKECDYVKSVIGSICIHALDNFNVFNESQTKNIISLINDLSYG